MSLYKQIEETISTLKVETISQERKLILRPLINFVKEKVIAKKLVNINFICTHNSRRSHLAQIWAKVMAANFGFENVIYFDIKDVGKSSAKFDIERLIFLNRKYIQNMKDEQLINLLTDYERKARYRAEKAGYQLSLFLGVQGNRQ